ncbi:MAG TPA: shikimate kinase [Rhizomicrobium sp.]|jgi:shikimate kinase
MGTLKRTVALVGMMGAGKSTIGRRLAGTIGVPFHDSDAEIETAAGCSIPEIFERFGESEFRTGERKVIARLLREPPHVMATGGGALLDPATRARLAADTFSIWLKAPVELLVARVERRHSRPLLRSGDPRETIQRLLEEREPVYALADIAFEVEDAPHAAMVQRILAALSERELYANA